jgi:aspartate-semialdehyde dehydrogenase
MLQKKDSYNVAIVGATGVVGRRMIAILEDRKFPVAEMTLLASSRSAGSTLEYKGEPIQIRELKEDSFKGIDMALFSAGGSVSQKFADFAIKANCIVIDNSSAFRMQDDVPLIVPEVNPDDIGENPTIIANPNCSTIQMVVALSPIHRKYKIRRIVVSTYQSVSGSGHKAIEELLDQTRSVLNETEVQKNVYPHQIAFNCLPHIDVFLENGYTKEEMKMVNETRKILGDNTIEISPTTVRMPVFYSHSEAVNVETEKPLSAQEIKALLGDSPGIEVVDNPQENRYPLAVDAEGLDPVFVGRIREDLSSRNAINLWIVADNLRKGAALNAVQIAELLISRQNN